MPHSSCCFYIHACTPNVVAMAVNTAMAIFRILAQIVLLSVSIFIVDVFGGTDYTDYTEPIRCLTRPPAITMTLILPL